MTQPLQLPFSPACEEIIYEIAADPVNFILGLVGITGIMFALIFGVSWVAYAMGVGQW
jgi:hypothetical protein